MNDAVFARMLLEMEKISEAMDQAGKEPNPERRRQILNAVVYDAERALHMRGLDQRAQDWFLEKWTTAGDEVVALESVRSRC